MENCYIENIFLLYGESHCCKSELRSQFDGEILLSYILIETWIQKLWIKRNKIFFGIIHPIQNQKNAEVRPAYSASSTSVLALKT